ncbi:MAG: hypothetical protein GY705_08600 [Bacteroidetes bacterium]|nr:hypothetical protein [Bacteroidota bacterium]
MEQQFQNQPTHSIVADTIIRKEVTVIYDTIYHSEIIPFSRILLYPQIIRQSSFLSNSGHEFRNRLFRYKISGSNLSSLKHDNPTIEEKTVLEGNEFIIGPPLSLLPPLSPSVVLFEEKVNFPHVEIKRISFEKRNLEYYLRKFSPSEFSLSALSGFSYSLVDAGGLFKPMASIRAEIKYGSRFSFIIGLEALNNGFEFENEDSEIDLSGFPEFMPENPNDVLHEINGDFIYLQIPFGVKYSFLTKGRFHPYLGLGLVSKKAITSSLKYEYLSIMNEYSLSQSGLASGSFKADDFWTTIGMKVDLNTRWRILLEGSSQIRLNQGNDFYQNTQILKLNTGIEYRF